MQKEAFEALSTTDPLTGIKNRSGLQQYIDEANSGYIPSRATLNLRVVSIDADQNLLVLRGAVPGAPNGVVVVRQAIAKKKDPQPQPEKAKKGKK